MPLEIYNNTMNYLVEEDDPLSSLMKVAKMCGSGGIDDIERLSDSCCHIFHLKAAIHTKRLA